MLQVLPSFLEEWDSELPFWKQLCKETMSEQVWRKFRELWMLLESKTKSKICLLFLTHKWPPKKSSLLMTKYIQGNFLKSYVNLHQSKEMSVATWDKTPILYSSTDCLFNKEGNQDKIIVLMMEWEYFSERLWISQATNWIARLTN